jgi:hypothetical protein
MPNELTNSLKSVAEKVAAYVEKVAELSVETQYMELDAKAVNFEGAHPAASTLIKLDGDCKSIIPMRRAASGGGLEVDAAIFELHQSNVSTAIEYRTRMMEALLQAFKEAVGR